MGDQAQQRRTLPAWVVAAEVCGLIGLILLGIYLSQHSGFDWSKSSFSYHPLFMVLGLVYLNGHAMMIYRVVPHAPKLAVKSAHGIVELLVITCVIVGLVAVFNAYGVNIKSLHSWLGLMTLVALLLQFLLGLSVFTCASLPMRTWFMPLHRWLGVSVLALGTGTAMVGMNKLASDTMICCAGVLLVLFAMLVGYVVTYAGFERPKEHEVVGEHTPLN